MNQTILILDDDVRLTMQWGKALEDAGFTVLLTHGADDALVVFAANTVDLCIVDFIIRENGKPTANGGISFLGKMDIAARMKTKILGISGMKQDKLLGLDAKQYLITFGAGEFLSKPFTDGELLAHVNNMLSAGSSG